MMNIGKHIRENRLRCNMTQERLAEKLNVTAQAVSKWESGATMPDITLLPELACLLGVTIDALFETSEEQLLDRIEAMQEQKVMLSRADFDYAMARLEELRHDPKFQARCLTLMADLCMNRSQGYAERAANYAMQALELEPERKQNHSLLYNARRGALGDWCCTNHTQLIDYYEGFVRKHPGYLPGYMWLTDNLIADGRLEEAQQMVEQMKSVRYTYHYPMYLAIIAQQKGQLELAEQYWQQMLSTFADEPVVWFVYGDALAKKAQYKEAIEAFAHSYALDKPPRYTDAQDSIAQLCLLLGDNEGAIRAYENVLRILRDDWQITEGEIVDNYRKSICKLQA